MKALLLAAGLGTRLKPFTFTQAKSSLPFLNVPLIHYSLHYLAAAGFEEAIINLHAYPESVRKVVGDSYRGMNIQYSFEPEILGTAGAMAKASTFLDAESVVVMNSDMICDVPLNKVLQHHHGCENLVTLVVMPKELSGYNPLDFDPVSLRLVEGSGSKCHYTGLQVVSRSVIEKIPGDRKTEIFRDIYPELIARNKVGVFLYEGLWMEMGTLSEFLKCAIQLTETPLPLHLVPPEMKPSLISDNAKLETGCEVSDTIVMDGAVVDANVKLQRCIVGPDVHVKKSYSSVALARGFLPWNF